MTRASHSVAATMSDEKHADLYGLLELQPDATEKDITKAYRKKALKYHVCLPTLVKIAIIVARCVQICSLLLFSLTKGLHPSTFFHLPTA